VTERMVY